VVELSNANAAAEITESYEGDGNDSDETIGGEPSASFLMSIPYGDGPEMKTKM
jgi:hypothetical protein